MFDCWPEYLMFFMLGVVIASILYDVNNSKAEIFFREDECMFDVIADMTKEAGATVTFFCENDEATYKHEQHAVDFCCSLTNWEEKRFYGHSRRQALFEAYEWMREENLNPL